MAAKTITVVCHDEKTYEVHLDLEGDPPRKAHGGMSLNHEHLVRELQQHGCSEDQINKAMQDLEGSRSATIYI